MGKDALTLASLQGGYVFMASQRRPSISTPIVLGTITVLLSIALLVGWTLLVLQNRAINPRVNVSTWLLAVGTLSFLMIMTVLILLIVFLVREILERRRQDTFIASVTHELKTPLASIRLCLETGMRPDLQAASRLRLQAMMLSDIERLGCFIDDILAASQVSARLPAAAYAAIDLQALMQRCVATVWARHMPLDAPALPNPIQGKLCVPKHIAFESDETTLTTVLINLLDNGLKYASSPAEVLFNIDWNDTTQRIHFSVTDNGIGLEKRHLRRIFDRFYRVDSEETRRRRGTGLGLYVAASWVRALGGKLDAQSQGLGCGSTMHFALRPQLASAGHKNKKQRAP